MLNVDKKIFWIILNSFYNLILLISISKNFDHALALLSLLKAYLSILPNFRALFLTFNLSGFL